MIIGVALDGLCPFLLFFLFAAVPVRLVHALWRHNEECLLAFFVSQSAAFHALYLLVLGISPTYLNQAVIQYCFWSLLLQVYNRTRYVAALKDLNSRGPNPDNEWHTTGDCYEGSCTTGVTGRL